MANREIIAEKELPSFHHWSDVLIRGKVAVSEADLKDAGKIFREFKCHNLEVYHSLYLKFLHSF